MLFVTLLACVFSYSTEDSSSDKSIDDISSNYSSDGEDNVDEQVKKEARILNGLSRYILKKVGKTVKTLVLECSKAITNGMVCLYFCFFVFQNSLILLA